MKSAESECNYNPTLADVLSAYEDQLPRLDAIPQVKSLEYLPEYEMVLEFLASKGKTHRNYRHYVTRNRALQIIKNNAIYLTDGSNWNDKFDSGRFNPPFMKTKRFGTCFSASSVESIAIWMLYGGVDGNGVMFNFDHRTLSNAMNRDYYECGYFDENGMFRNTVTLSAEHVNMSLIDILYFMPKESGGVEIGRSSLEGGRYELDSKAFDAIAQIAKHRSWSYENEVRLIATIDKRFLHQKATGVQCVKIPLNLDSAFVNTKVFDSPTSDGDGCFCDSELTQTVDWSLCAGCPKMNS